MSRLFQWLSRSSLVALSAASTVLLGTSATFAQATVLRVVGFNGETPDDIKTQLLQRIQRLELELEELQRLVEEQL
jgi:spermidine/putrescine-binding protein